MPLLCLQYHLVEANNMHRPVSCEHMEGAVVWEISPGSLFFHLVFDVYSAILGEQGYEY